jgi:hypothetical protein
MAINTPFFTHTLPRLLSRMMRRRSAKSNRHLDEMTIMWNA